MKKKGFTLIELLAVLVILGIIAMITVVSVNSIINSSKKEISEIQINNIEESAKAYYIKEGMSKNDKCVSVSHLIKQGYIEGENVINPETKDEITGFVKITYEANQYLYKYQKEACIYTAATEETKTTGAIPETDEDGNIKPGSEFKIKVSDEIGELTFFVLSNSSDEKYVNLIAEQNIAPDGTYTSELQDGDEWYKETASVSKNNRYGPQTAYAYLSTATSNWTNIPIIEYFDSIDEGNQSNSTYGYQSIETTLDSSTGKYITTIIPLTATPVAYENMRARLPKYSEIIENTNCNTIEGKCPLWMVNYLKSTEDYSVGDGKINSIGNNYGYWLLSAHSGSDSHAKNVYYEGRVYYRETIDINTGVRPVITVLKSDLLKAM